MIPNKLPIWKTDDILSSPSDYEDEKTGKKTTVGWLKSLYLWKKEGDYLLQSTASDKRDYANAKKEFKKVNKIPQSVDLHDWEDETNISQQRIALNRFRKEIMKNANKKLQSFN